MKTPIQPVDVTVLYTEGCAGTPPTIDLIKDVAREMDVSIRLSEILVQSADQATELKFLGSPTVHVNGADIDPAARANTNYGLT
jgi:hypothetical protein